MENLTEAENRCVSTKMDHTGGLSGLHSSSQQSSQQFGYRYSDVVVGSFEGPEAQSGHVFQLAGPQERRLPLQLQQTLTETQQLLVSLHTDRRRKTQKLQSTLQNFDSGKRVCKKTGALSSQH